jgi:hypothetical protein
VPSGFFPLTVLKMASIASWQPRARNLRPPDSAHIITVPVTDLSMARIRRRRVLGGLICE